MKISDIEGLDNFDSYTKSDDDLLEPGELNIRC